MTISVSTRVRSWFHRPVPAAIAPPLVIPPRVANRMERLRGMLDRGMAIIEVGPSHNPVAAKRDGWRTTVVDHASRDDLAAKYADHGVDLSRLEDVDVVWSGGALEAGFAEGSLGTFDAVITSHVLEHLPDPVSFLLSVQRLLKPGGIMVVALPDKRFCFDFFGGLTTMGDWLAAYEVKAAVHSNRAAFNHVAYAVQNAGAISWSGQPRADALELNSTLQVAMRHFRVATDRPARYTDYHAWRFTPSSFRLVMLEASALCGLRLRVAQCGPTVNHEFHVRLVYEPGEAVAIDDAEMQRARLALMRDIVAELAEQVVVEA